MIALLLRAAQPPRSISVNETYDHNTLGQYAALYTGVPKITVPFVATQYAVPPSFGGCGGCPMPMCQPRPMCPPPPLPLCPTPPPCPLQFCPPPPLCPPPPMCPPPPPPPPPPPMCGCARPAYIPMYPSYAFRSPYPMQGTYPIASGPSFGSGGGCGGGPPIAPPPRPPAQNDCCCGCSAPCKYKRKALYSSKTVDPSCNSENLRTIIQEYITDDATSSKRAIQEAAEDNLNVTVNVICGKGEFSYVAHTDSFCQSSKDDITCYAFQPL